MRSFELPSAFRRGRVIATAAVAVAAAAAVVVPNLSSAAADVTSPVTIKIDGFAPNTVNDGVSGWNPTNSASIEAFNNTGAFIRVDNPSTSNYRFQYQTILTGPAGLTASMFTNPNTTIVNDLQGGVITLRPNTAGNNCPAMSFCSHPTTITDPIPPHYDVSGTLSVTLDTRTGSTAAITGPYTVTVALTEVSNITGNFIKTLGSTTVSSNLGDPAPPVLASSLPTGTVNQPYSAQLVTDPGFPPAPVFLHNEFTANCCPPYPPNKPYQAGYRVYLHHADGTATEVTENSDGTFSLTDGLVFDTATGQVTASEYAMGLGDTRVTSYTIVANNGVGGASTKLVGNLAHDIIPVEYHDVSTTISISVLFSDVPADYAFATEIYTLANLGILQGFADGTFRPLAPVRRQEFAQFAAEYLNNFGPGTGHSDTGACTTNRPSPFPDVANTSQFCAEIRDLSTQGVIHGYKDGTFRPTQTISRQEISGLLYRIHEAYLGIDLNAGSDPICTSSPFPDVPVTDVFCGDILFMAQHGISTGYADGTFRPFATARRQEAAAFIYRLGKYDSAF